MFEKEVKKSFIKRYPNNSAINTYYNEGFKDGAEFGYNKANEWHYVKDELPPEHIPLNILTLDKDKKKRLWTGEYKGGNGEYWTGYFNHFIDKPYAWKEIVLPKEIKENDL